MSVPMKPNGKTPMHPQQQAPLPPPHPAMVAVSEAMLFHNAIANVISASAAQSFAQALSGYGAHMQRISDHAQALVQQNAELARQVASYAALDAKAARAAAAAAARAKANGAATNGEVADDRQDGEGVEGGEREGETPIA